MQALSRKITQLVRTLNEVTENNKGGAGPWSVILHGDCYIVYVGDYIVTQKYSHKEVVDWLADYVAFARGLKTMTKPWGAD